MEKAKSQTFKCEICDQVLKTKDKLQRHFDVVHKYYKCDSCSKSFAFRQSLNLHKNTIHNSSRKDHNNCCDFCDKSFSSAKNLDKHINAFHGNVHKNNKCDTCGKSYITRGYGTGVAGVALATPRFLNLIHNFFLKSEPRSSSNYLIL